MAGIGYAVKTGINFRIQAVAAVITIAAALLLRVSVNEWLVLILCIGTVLCLELLNTVIERLCNLYSLSYSPEIRIIKDLAAGMVLLFAVAAMACGLIIFLPKIINLFNSVI
jgi:diacylglycerol kinase